MDSFEIVVSPQVLIRAFVILLYVLVCLFSFWRLIPRLSPEARRLAVGMLAAQIIVIVVALEIEPTSKFERYLWLFSGADWNGGEWNIPAMLASTQLALVGGVALLAAWLDCTRTAWQRFYLVGIGVLFLFLGLDEYLTLHEYILNWGTYYGALGVGLAVATMFVAARSPRYVLKWLVCLLTGLAMAALGAMVFDTLWTCDNLGLLRLDGCLDFSMWEEALEYAGIWLVLVGMLGLFSDVVSTPSPGVSRLLYAMPVLWMLVLLLNSLVPRLEVRLLAQPANVQFASGIQLRGYHIDRGGGSRILRLYASARQEDYIGLGYSSHLVDQVTGESIASRDQWADRRHGFWPFGPDYSPVFLQWMEVEIPPQAPTNRALWVVLTLWRKRDRDFVRQKILASDHKLLDETQVVLGELVLPANSAASSTVAPLAVFVNGFALETVDLPERAQAGETLRIPLTWHSDESGQEDLVQFLHFGFENSGDWWVYDRPPLGPRLPTRLWYSGLADSEVWEVPLPPDLAPGRYEVFTGLYRSRDLERVSARDADGLAWLDGRVSLGALIID